MRGSCTPDFRTNLESDVMRKRTRKFETLGDRKMIANFGPSKLCQVADTAGFTSCSGFHGSGTGMVKPLTARVYKLMVSPMVFMDIAPATESASAG
jgi:hypothetical protein